MRQFVVATMLPAWLAVMTTVAARPPACAQVVARVSVSSTGEQGNNDSSGLNITLSPDGRLVVFTSSATNLVTGIAYAQLNGIPLLAITGQKGIRENWQADFQVIDVVDMMQSLTKRTVQIQGPKSIPKEIRSAFKIATTERHGACHIELPEDVAHEDVEVRFRPLEPGVIRRPNADPKAVRLAAEKIRSAKQPVIIVSSRAQR